MYLKSVYIERNRLRLSLTRPRPPLHLSTKERIWPRCPNKAPSTCAMPRHSSGAVHGTHLLGENTKFPDPLVIHAHVVEAIEGPRVLLGLRRDCHLPGPNRTALALKVGAPALWQAGRWVGMQAAAGPRGKSQQAQPVDDTRTRESLSAGLH